ncbi:MAG: hypothetical protein ACMUEM_02130 [Flavobacteriales bacterium AspAUS03]
MKSGRNKDKIFNQNTLTYIHEKITELLTGEPAVEKFYSKATEWGKSHESLAEVLLKENYTPDIEYLNLKIPQYQLQPL